VNPRATGFMLAPSANQEAGRTSAVETSLARAAQIGSGTAGHRTFGHHEPCGETPHAQALDIERSAIPTLLYRVHAALLGGQTDAALEALEHALMLHGVPLPDDGGDGLRRCGNAPGAWSTAQQAEPYAYAAEIHADARVVIRTLGGFEIWVDGARLDSGRKQPRRILTMLKAIIALGGARIRPAALADLLWPDLEGDRAHDALQVTLHRLRARLDVPGAVICHGGLVSLHPRLVWVDAIAFDSASQPGSAGPIEQSLPLYKGEFLPEELGAHWTAHPRERLRGRFRRVVTTIGQKLEEGQRVEEAVDLYLGAIDVDDLASVFHDGLIRCLRKLGRCHEADSAHQRQRRLQEADRAWRFAPADLHRRSIC